MTDYSTFMNNEETDAVVRACGDEIREFLSFLAGVSEDSPYQYLPEKEQLLSEIVPELRDSAQQFKSTPQEFTDEKLVEKGEDFRVSIHNPVRIEVRCSKMREGAAQIAARGIHGSFRNITLQQIKARDAVKERNLDVRVSGSASFEVNRSGVNKGLSLKYLRRYFDKILSEMQYSGGEKIDSLLTYSIITADGDGTTYDSPDTRSAPTLKESKTYSALMSYLGVGGIYMVISGNDLERTFDRIKGAMNDHTFNNFLIVANGGASMAFIRSNELIEIEDYQDQALNLLEQEEKGQELDILYIGDDGRINGNDIDAFEEVGWGRSILVANYNSDVIISTLEDQCIGQGVNGCERILQYVNVLAQNRDGVDGPLFTLENIRNMVQFARGAS